MLSHLFYSLSLHWDSPIAWWGSRASVLRYTLRNHLLIFATTTWRCLQISDKHRGTPGKRLQVLATTLDYRLVTPTCTPFPSFTLGDKRQGEESRTNRPYLSFLFCYHLYHQDYFSELNVASKKYYALKRQQEFTFITNGRNSSFNTGRFRFQFTRTVTDIVDGKRV